MDLYQGFKFVDRKMYRAVCKDRLEKACLMDLFLFMDANSSNSAMMALSEL